MQLASQLSECLQSLEGKEASMGHSRIQSRRRVSLGEQKPIALVSVRSCWVNPEVMEEQDSEDLCNGKGSSEVT